MDSPARHQTAGSGLEALERIVICDLEAEEPNRKSRPLIKHSYESVSAELAVSF